MQKFKRWNQARIVKRNARYTEKVMRRFAKNLPTAS